MVGAGLENQIYFKGWSKALRISENTWKGKRKNKRGLKEILSVSSSHATTLSKRLLHISGGCVHVPSLFESDRSSASWRNQWFGECRAAVKSSLIKSSQVPSSSPGQCFVRHQYSIVNSFTHLGLFMTDFTPDTGVVKNNSRAYHTILRFMSFRVLVRLWAHMVCDWCCHKLSSASLNNWIQWAE